MASNTTLNSGTGGDVIATKERTHDGDATKVQVVTLAGVTGTEGAYTFADIASGAGAESAALRVTLATESLAALESVTVVDGGSTISVDDGGGALTVDGTVSVTGVATAANQTTIIGHLDGVEGLLTTIDADTGSLAGCVAGTELQVDIVAGGITGRAEDSAHSTGHEGVVVLAVRRDTPAVGSDTDGDYSTINVNSAGRVYTSTTVDAALPAGTNNIGDVDVLSVVPGTGATELGKAEDAAHTTGDTGVAMLAVRRDTAAVGSGTDGDYSTINVDASGRVWTSAVQSGTWTVQPGNTANTTAWLVSPRPATSGGLSIFRSIDLDETEEEIKATAGQLYGYYFANTNAAARYLKFYNATAANVTVGTTTPVLTFYLPPTTAGHVEFSHGIAFSTAITAAATTGVADNDTGAPGANEVILNAFYA